MKLKIISRAVVREQGHIILVKNFGKDYWSLPGGHWEYEKETLRECAAREVLEETGYYVNVEDVLFCKEFENKSAKVIEFIWSASISPNQSINFDLKHRDADVESEIEEVRWFSIDDAKSIVILPAAVKDLIHNGIVTKRHMDN